MTTLLRNISKTALLGTVAVLQFSCKKFVEVDISPDLVGAKTVFETESSLLSAVSGTYVLLRGASLDMSNAGMSVYVGLSSDEIYNTASNANYDPFVRNSLLSNNSVIYQNFWRTSYRNIYSINAILEGLALSDKLDQQLKNRYAAEMKVLRAWYYFYLVNLFGDVPLVVHTAYEANATLPRTASGVVNQAIITDLKEAKSHLLEEYPSSGKLRVNKWTATALLSRAYLFVKDYERAEADASEIVNSNRYALVSDLNAVFLSGSQETIWEVAIRNGNNNTQLGSTYIPTNGTSRPVLALTSHLVNAFSPTDLRLANWVKSNTNGGIRYYYPFKQKQRTVTTPITEENTMIRYDEVLLIRAEANAALDQLDAARSDLNRIRRRAGLGDTPASTKEEILKAILEERRLELFAEWGHRWFDLKRTGEINTVLKAVKGELWQETDSLFPIPMSEINYNPQLKQNPGY